MANEADLNTSWTNTNAQLLHISTDRYHRKVMADYQFCQIIILKSSLQSLPYQLAAWNSARRSYMSNVICARLLCLLKTWELVYILEVINSQQLCKPGSKGLVFAAGIEPLTSTFAQQGCSIHATDYPADAADASNEWVSQQQLYKAQGLQLPHDGRLHD